MFRAWSSGFLLFLLGGAVAAPPAQATVMIYMKTKELTERAASVVRGTVERQQAVEIKGHLWTDSYVRVAETLKGNTTTGEILILRQPGGETITIGERVVGAAQFAIGEEVLVFARPNADGVHVPVGMCLGKFRVQRGKDGLARASRDFDGVAFAAFDPRGRFTLHHAHGANQRRLVDLKQEILRAQKTGGAR